MLLWLKFKALQQPMQLESGLARGVQKNSISFDLMQNMVIRGVGAKASEHYPTQLPLKASFLLLTTQSCPRWRRCMAGWLACWLAGLAGWLRWLGWLGWLGWLDCRVVGWQGKSYYYYY